MAVAFRDKSSNSSAASPLTISVPAATVNGDLMVAIICRGTSAAIPATPTGWTLLDSASTGPSAATFYRVASSEPASYDFTDASSGIMIGAIVSYSGAASASFINAHGALNRDTTTNHTATSITTTVAGCMLVYVTALGSGSAVTAPSGWTARASLVGNGLTVETSDLAQVSAGATGSVTGTTATGGNSLSGLIAIAPAAGSAPSNSVAPAVTGTAQVGSTLTTTNGTWTDDGTGAFTYQWQDCATSNGTFANISGATSSTYSIASGEATKYILCNVTDTDGNGNTPAASNVVGPVAAAATSIYNIQLAHSPGRFLRQKGIH